jgi:hypothetical protein
MSAVGICKRAANGADPPRRASLVQERVTSPVIWVIVLVAVLR